ncbi:hypothetical protein BGZ97_011305 [Linnemannia gamsii]|uniref:Myb-like domain-containing protein n=1 Tax=Linnemannia gamsii TaxID=64522 RepID=A0A9P6R432_9FUNG|nr:hypothetical protein BGZ97_011305 [Linnemannia gamsii]
MMQWSRGHYKVPPRNKTWAREEVELLEQLVQKYIDIPHPHIWHEVAFGDIDGLPVLKEGSEPLKMLNWVAIAEKVKSRRDHDCRDHFYTVYHNGNRGPWSEDELRRAREGVEMFGNDYRRIAQYVGTRSAFQVTKMVYIKRLSRKDSVDSEENHMEDIKAT